MREEISTIFNNKDEVSSDADKFYKDYWTDGSEITQRTRSKNEVIVSSYFPGGLSGKRILEVGVGGEGGVINLLKNNNYVEGADISDSAIMNCRKIGLKVIKSNLDTDTLPFEDGYFDAVFAFEIFEHFSNPQHALEEIKRVLKSGGTLAASIPTPLTYHWPRLFYPSLFEFENFSEFMMINGFRVNFMDIKLFRNIHGYQDIDEKDKLLSWFWECRKLDKNDAEAYWSIGRYFWEQKSEHNLRLKPVQAMEMFRKSYQIDNKNVKAKLWYLKSLLYRLLLGNSQEFDSLLNSMNDEIVTPAFQSNPDYLYELLMIDVEAKSMKQEGFNKGFTDTVINLIKNISGGEKYLENYKLEKIYAGIKE